MTLTLPSAAFAQAPDAEPLAKILKPQVEGIFKAIDKDGNGRIKGDELAGAKWLAPLDADGAVTLEEIQSALLARATALRDANTVKIDTKEDFYAFFTAKNSDKPEIHGGFALAHWNGSAAVEEKMKEDLKVTIRCIPFGTPEEDGKCILYRRAESEVRGLGEVILTGDFAAATAPPRSEPRGPTRTAPARRPRDRPARESK